MDFSKASLAEMKAFVKDNGIKGCSAMKKAELAKYLTEYVEKHVTAVAVDSANTKAAPKAAAVRNDADVVAESSTYTTESSVEDKKETAAETVTGAGQQQRKGRRIVGFQGKNGARQSRQSMHFEPRQRQAEQGENRQTENRYENRSEYRSESRSESRSEARQADQRQMDQRTGDQRRQAYTETRSEEPVVQEGQEQAEQKNVPAYAQGEYHPELDSGRIAHGILEVMAEGYGFIRSANYLPGDQDIYVSPAQIRRFGLKTGDIITGNIRNKTQGEKFSALLYVASVNDESPLVIANRKNFEDLTPIFPNERIELDGAGAPIPIRMINLLAPIGKGQRGMIVSPPKTGKTTLLKQIAKKISTSYDDMHLLVLLIDERPEEVTDIRESIEGPNVEVIYSTFDELPEHHKRVSEMVIERAKRLVESKKDVVILLDSITRLARAYNLTVSPSGRTLSGGLDPAALYMPKRFFGAARNMREGGSLTILATALVDTGSKMDDVVFEEFKGTGNMELVLDRKLSEKRIFPAIDIAKSGTRRDDLLLSREEQEVVTAIHKELMGSRSEDVLEDVRKLFIRTKDNKEFIQYIKQSLLRK